jgi:hypothetical protein
VDPEQNDLLQLVEKRDVGVGRGLDDGDGRHEGL